MTAAHFIGFALDSNLSIRVHFNGFNAFVKWTSERNFLLFPILNIIPPTIQAHSVLIVGLSGSKYRDAFFLTAHAHFRHDWLFELLSFLVFLNISLEFLGDSFIPSEYVGHKSEINQRETSFNWTLQN